MAMEITKTKMAEEMMEIIMEGVVAVAVVAVAEEVVVKEAALINLIVNQATITTFSGTPIRQCQLSKSLATSGLNA